MPTELYKLELKRRAATIAAGAKRSRWGRSLCPVCGIPKSPRALAGHILRTHSARLMESKPEQLA